MKYPNISAKDRAYVSANEANILELKKSICKIIDWINEHDGNSVKVTPPIKFIDCNNCGEKVIPLIIHEICPACKCDM